MSRQEDVDEDNRYEDSCKDDCDEDGADDDENLKMEVLEVQTPPIFLDFPPNFRLIMKNSFSLYCVETVLPIFC